GTVLQLILQNLAAICRTLVKSKDVENAKYLRLQVYHRIQHYETKNRNYSSKELWGYVNLIILPEL
ncbi:MAG: hypothetical protein K6G87_17275, partial [Butyrivibrio sp.]|uniref:hypothetical protein n=1 Tax=Butyrivibrio sp. TaxID=28121 RepID=UPI0025F81542